MTIDERELFDIFSGLPVAMLAVEGGTVKYANSAATELFGCKMEGAPAGRVIGRELERGSWTEASGEIEAGGGTVTASYHRLGDMVIVNAGMRDDPEEQVRALAASLTDAVWEHLSVCAMATDLVIGRAKDSSDLASLSYLSMMDRAVHAMSRITSNTARVFNGIDSTYKFMVLDLGDLIGDLITTTAALARHRTVEFKFSPPRDRVVYRADPEKMELMLMELISNSLIHTPDGGSICVSLRSGPAGVLITVSDTGEGISGDALSGIFRRCLTRRVKGAPHAGMGLGVAQLVANAHGGRIIVESTRAVGASVTVSLPPTDLTVDDMNFKESVPKSSPTVLLTEYSEVLDSAVYLDKDSM